MIDPEDSKTEDLGSDIASHLKRHDISVDVHVLDSGSATVGERLIHAIADMDPDVVIMGEYGHSHLHEIILGSATRTLLGSMPTTLFLSH